MSDLESFLRARLDEDEAAARSAIEAARQMEWPPFSPPSSVLQDTPVRDVRYHIARHDPARVLREVAAKRAILEAYEEQDGWDLPEGFTDGRDWDEREIDAAIKMSLADLALRTLVTIYSDHPDYKPEWKP